MDNALNSKNTKKHVLRATYKHLDKIKNGRNEIVIT